MKRVLEGLRNSESGFTLIEMLIVLGIIVALAAAVVPQLGLFSGSGEAGGKDAELSGMKTALQTAMVDAGVSSVTANSGVGGVLGPAQNDFSATPVEIPGGLGKYLDANVTTFFYCYNTSGRVTLQQDAATPNCT